MKFETSARGLFQPKYKNMYLRTGPLLSPSSMWGPRPDRPRDEPVEGQTNAAADLDSEKQHKKEEV